VPKYKTPDGNSIDIGGEHFAADVDGCITVPNENYHTLLAPLGCELQPEAAPVVVEAAAAITEPVVEPVKSSFNAFAAASDPAASE
jgi:hypothetical protein